MVTQEILNSHTVATLKREVGKVKKELKISGKKKSEIVEIMLKNKSLFSHIKHANKITRKTPVTKSKASKPSVPTITVTEEPKKRKKVTKVVKSKLPPLKEKPMRFKLPSEPKAKAPPKPTVPKPQTPKVLNMNMKYLVTRKSARGVTYRYKHRNLYVQVDIDGPSDNPDSVYLAYFNSRYEPEKALAAPKGYASRVLCQLIHYFIKKNLINKDLPLKLEAMNLLGGLGSQKKLESYYKRLGFKKIDKYTGRMEQPVGEFLKICKKDNRLVEELANK